MKNKFRKINPIKKLVLMLIMSLCSSTLISQGLISPIGLTTSPANIIGLPASCYNGSGLFGIPNNVTSAQNVLHVNPANAINAAFSGAGLMETHWTFSLGATPQNITGIALWLPCANTPHGDAPFKKIAVFNGTTTDIFELGVPSDTVKIIYFSSTYVGATSIEIQVLETWYDLTLTASCGASGWGVYNTSSTNIHSLHNVMLGEIMFILDHDVPDPNPCAIEITVEETIDKCGLTLNSSIANIPAGYMVMSTTWTFGDGYSSNLLNASHYYANVGVYEVCLEVIIFNGEECCTVEKCFEIEIEEPCEGDCNMEAEIEIGQLEDCEFQFSGNILYTGTPITNWVWNFGDGTTAIGSHVNHTYATNGTYIVTLTVFGSSPNNEECCFTTIKREVSVNCVPEQKFKAISNQSNINEEALNNVTLYPNPSNGTVNISFDLANDDQISIIIIDASGKRVYNGTLVNKTAGTHNIELSTDLPRGSYTSIISTKFNKVYKKLIIL